MKILLTAVNAKYIHSNLALYSLRAYAREFAQYLSMAEFTINQPLDFVMRKIYKQRPDVLCFSCYIWNISFVEALSREFHKLLPDVPIWLGGPEVSYESEAFLKKHPQITGIIRGEGEEAFRRLCRYYVKGDMDLREIPGVLFREKGDQIPENYCLMPPGEPLPMDRLPFCYGEPEMELSELENRIVYYESSRGCPFQCSYCLSSLDKKLRFRSLSLVKDELQFFLDRKVRQVKFVDRTFNCNHEHAMAVWQYLLEHDNGVTNFHFEISADLLKEEELELLGRMRPGLVQLEIGVQTTNLDTIGEIRRTMDFGRLSAAVLAIRRAGNIHQHLDLIAGLPLEDYHSFRLSFDAVYGLHPQQLQLGFLKVLKGSYLYENRERYGILCHDSPPYEVLSTRWLSYEELQRIKLVEEMLEVYGNSGQYEIAIGLLETEYDSPFQMFLELGEFYEKRELRGRNHSRMGRCEILLDFLEEKRSGCGPEEAFDPELYREALTFDLYYRENMKSRPAWAMDPGLFKEQARGLLKKGENAHLEPFYYDFSGWLDKKDVRPKRQEQWRFYRFSYDKRDPLTHQARVEEVRNEGEGV